MILGWDWSRCLCGAVLLQAFTVENNVDLCNDGIDNDCNGVKDEDEPNCLDMTRR